MGVMVGALWLIEVVKWASPVPMKMKGNILFDMSCLDSRDLAPTRLTSLV